MSIMDSLTQVMDTVSNVTQPIATNTSTNGSYQWAYWVGAALATCVIALGLLKKKNSEQDVLKKKMKEGDIDFGNVINSAFYSKELYDILKKKCHPDRFAGNPVLIEKSTEIFAFITKNKYDHISLLKLKERAEKELFVKF